MSPNRVTIFSNGIADFRRTYAVQKITPTEVSIPVRKDHIADVLGSLNVFGHVTLKSPPSFRPSNETETNLSIDTDNVLEGFAQRLAGARVVVAKSGDSLEGKMVGLHTEEVGNGLTRIVHKFLVILSESGLQRVPISEVQSLQFADATVQSEIDKALQRNFERVKPNSTFVDLSLATEEDETEAIVQYTVPAAAWKISYRLRQNGDEPFEFQGFAVVDNNTEEDWNDFLVCVVTGEPITFSTDLADSKTPRRRHVNVVRDVALGAIEVEEADFDLADDASAEGAGAVYSDAMMLQSNRSMMRKASAAPMAYAAEAAAPEAPAARMAEAEVREVGDFCVFEATTPISIGANRSAAIPVFSTALDESEVVLHYKAENHPERPYRAIQFKNQTDFSLGRGVCTVFQDGAYAGSCIMPATKPGGDGMLPHALETGVRVRHEQKRLRRKVVGVRLSEGFGYTSYHETQKTLYRIKNNRKEGFQFVLDHDHVLNEPLVDCTIIGPDGSRTSFDTPESLASGFRARIDLDASAEIAFVVVESRVQESAVRLVNVSPKREQLNVQWLQDNLVATNGPLASDPGIRKCLDIQRRLDAKRAEIQDAVTETERLAARQERLRKNIKTGGHDDQTGRWKTDLGNAEDKIVELEETTIPRLRTEDSQIRKELQTAMMALAAEWTEAE